MYNFKCLYKLYNRRCNPPTPKKGEKKLLIFKNLTYGSQFTYHGEMTNEFKGGQFVIKLIYGLCLINSKA